MIENNNEYIPRYEKLQLDRDAMRESLARVLLAYKKLDSEMSDSDLDDEQPKNISLTLGDIRRMQKYLRKPTSNAEFFADSDKLPPLEKKLPWGLRPRQG